MASCSATPLGQSIGLPGFHSDLVFRQDATYGNSVFTSATLPPGSCVVSCSLDVAITPAKSRDRLAPVASASTESWSDHEAMCTYLAMHRLAPAGFELAHKAYVASLPKEDECRTPLYYTRAELQLLAGLNLQSATAERKEKWREEWQGVQAKLKTEVQLPWELYLWASTMLSSRAFPSSLIDSDVANSTPVLFPGVDTLNHLYGQKVSWLTDVDSGTLSVVLDNEVPAGVQVMNSYGAKPNEEFLLGYGFTTPDNPADVVALLLPLPASPPTLSSTLSSLSLPTLRHFVPRSGILPPELLAQLRLFLATDEERDEVEAASREGQEWPEVLRFLSWFNELDMLDALRGMVQSKLDMVKRLPESGSEGDIREEVRADIHNYRQGQIDVLQAAVQWANKTFADKQREAEADGVDFGDGSDDDNSEEGEDW